MIGKIRFLTGYAKSFHSNVEDFFEDVRGFGCLLPHAF